MLLDIRHKLFPLASFGVLFLTIIVFAWTGKYYFLAAPFAYLYVVLMGLNWKTAYWMLLFSIPFSVQINFNSDTASITLPDQPVMWLFLGLFLVLFARSPRVIPTWYLRDPLVLIVVLQFIWTVVAVIFSKMIFFSVKFLLVKIWLLVSFFIFPVWIFQKKKDFTRGFLLLLVPMFFTILAILASHARYGFKFEKIQRAVMDTMLYYNPVDYATVISMFFPLLIVTCWPLIRRRNVLIKLTLILVVLVFCAGIWFSFRRAALVGLVFALVIGIAMRLRMARLVMPVFYGLMVVLVVYMVDNNTYIEYRPNYNNTYMHKTLKDHLIATIRGQDMSSMERVYRWVAAVRMSTDEPITGYGPRAFYYYYKPYAVTSFRTYVSRNTEQSTTHNYFLYMLVEQGWPAMILYAILMMAIFAKAEQVYHRFKDRYYRLVTMGLAMLLAVGFINNFFSELIETHKVAALFYIPLAMLIILDKKSRDEQKALHEGVAYEVS